MLHSPVFVLATIFGGISLIIYTIASHKLKTKILDAGKIELDPETIKALYGSARNRLGTLKWGLISLFSGIGLVVIHYIPYEVNDTLPWGIALSFVALGFLIYFLLAKQLESK